MEANFSLHYLTILITWMENTASLELSMKGLKLLMRWIKLWSMNTISRSEILGLLLINRKVTDIYAFRISHTIVLEDPFPDPPMIRYPSRSPSPGFDLVDVCFNEFCQNKFNIFRFPTKLHSIKKSMRMKARQLNKSNAKFKIVTWKQMLRFLKWLETFTTSMRNRLTTCFLFASWIQSLLTKTWKWFLVSVETSRNAKLFEIGAQNNHCNTRLSNSKP